MATTQDLFDQYLEPSVTLQPGERVLTVGGKQNYDQGIKAAEGGNYGAIGPPTRSGGRAYGAHQVMDFNIPTWTKEVLGTALTPQEFLNNKEAQDKVFQTKFGQLVQKYGNAQDAASAWFTGRPYAEAKAAGANDGYHDVDWYINRFNSGTGQGSGAQPTSYQPSQQPEFGLAKTTGDLFDRLGTIIQGTTPAPDIKPYEMKPTPVPASVAALPDTPGAKVAASPVGYSGTSNLLNAMGAGLNPYSVGLGRALSGAYADWQGGKGVGAALSNAPAYYSAGRDTYNAEREAWSQENPGTAAATNIAGGIVPAAAAISGVGALGTALKTAAPVTGEALSLLAGKGPTWSSGASIPARLGSMAVGGGGQGATSGAAQTGITGGNPLSNASGGAAAGLALGVPFGVAGGGLLSPLRAPVSAPMNALAGELEQRGVNLPGSLLTQDKGVQRLAGKAGVITDDLKKRVGEVFADRYEQIGKQTGVQLDPQFRQELLAASQKMLSARSLPEEVKRKLADIIRRVNSPNGNMSGPDLVRFTRRDGELNALQQSNQTKDFAEPILTAIWENLARQKPAEYQVLRNLDSQWKAWAGAKSGATTIDVAKQIAHAAGTGVLGGELAYGALSGVINPVEIASMIAHGPHLLPIAAGALGAGAGYLARQGAARFVNSPLSGSPLNYGNILRGGGVGPLPNIAIPPAAQIWNEERQRR